MAAPQTVKMPRRCPQRGPRKLPELGKTLGRSLAEFKRASNELKMTLEEEIRTEERQSAKKAEAPPLPAAPTTVATAEPPPTQRVDTGA